MGISQRDAVFQAVCRVVEPNGNAVKLDESQKKAVHSDLIERFVAGEIEYRGQATREQFTKYVPGLVNNWLRKDARLNGNVKYIPKNPGSRMGSGDEAIKAMRALLSVTSDPTARAEIERAIEDRKLELKPETPINVGALPEHLRKFAPVKN